MESVRDAKASAIESSDKEMIETEKEKARDTKNVEMGGCNVNKEDTEVNDGGSSDCTNTTPLTEEAASSEDEDDYGDSDFESSPAHLSPHEQTSDDECEYSDDEFED